MTTKRQNTSGSRAGGQQNRPRGDGSADRPQGYVNAKGSVGESRGGRGRQEGKAAATVFSRELSLDILMEILERGALSHVILNQALTKYQYLDKQDRAFIMRVVEGTLEYQIQIDYVIDRYSRTKVQKMKPLIRTLLRMSVYQILYMDRIPDSAVCNEAVKLAAKRRFEGLKGFVNGILRSIAREKDSYIVWRENGGADPWPDDTVRYSMPQWLIEMWTEAYGGETARGMMEAFLKERPFSVRCNLDKASKEEIMKSLRLQGVTAVENAYAEDMLYLENIDYPERLTAFQTGLITVQDFSSACVAKAAGLKFGNTVLDVCGAPGGKTIHAASILRKAWQDGRLTSAKDIAAAPMMGMPLDTDDMVFCCISGEVSEENMHTFNSVSGLPKDSLRAGHVFVRDISERKAAMIAENVRRCGYEDMVTVQVWDALAFDEDMAEKADVVFADLPCSGLGVIGRKPDIKGRIRPEDIGVLAALQREILSVVWQYVKPGGILVYSTCTVSPQENIGNRDWFLANYPFESVDITGRLGGRISADTMTDGYIQLLPGQYPCDGFFLAVMRRL